MCWHIVNQSLVQTYVMCLSDWTLCWTQSGATTLSGQCPDCGPTTTTWPWWCPSCRTQTNTASWPVSPSLPCLSTSALLRWVGNQVFTSSSCETVIMQDYDPFKGHRPYILLFNIHFCTCLEINQVSSVNSFSKVSSFEQHPFQHYILNSYSWLFQNSDTSLHFV